MTRIPILVAVLFALWASPARAENGLTAAQILNTQIGARSSAMGRAFTAVPGDAESLNYNPAGLAFIKNITASMSYMKGFSGGDYGFIAAAVPVKTFVFSPAFLYYNSGTINLNFSNGTKASVTAEEDSVAQMLAAWLPVRRLGVGVTIKHSRLELAETASAKSINYDFGALYDPGWGFTLGAAHLNSGGEIKFEEAGDPPPKTVRIGAAYKLVFTPPNLLDPSADLSYCDFIVSVDWSRVNKEDAYYQTGGELNMVMMENVILSLRFGYQPERFAENTLFGLGVRKGAWAFNYSGGSAKELNSRQQITVEYKYDR